MKTEPNLARQALIDRLTRIDPNLGIITMRTVARLEIFFLEIAFWVSLILGGRGVGHGHILE